jgi:hypothetical protein
MDLRPYLNRWVIVGGLLFAGALLVVTLIMIGWTSPRFSPSVGFVPADLTMIPAPTHTPSVIATATVDPAQATTTAADSIAVGGYVQINGTEGDGLRIRSSAGLTGETVFRGEEAEVFVVRDGPQTADGYTWWYLVAPYDDTRAGWAVADFLAVVPAP